MFNPCERGLSSNASRGQNPLVIKKKNHKHFVTTKWKCWKSKTQNLLKNYCVFICGVACYSTWTVSVSPVFQNKKSLPIKWYFFTLKCYDNTDKKKWEEWDGLVWIARLETGVYLYIYINKNKKNMFLLVSQKF